MDLKLISMSIRNFKGISEQTICFDGNDTRIRGANATGKTSIVDAFMWLLFGKDAAGDKNFPIKPKDADGNEVHNLMTEVECVFNESGRPLKLRRRMEEKWTKPRGRAEAVYGGNTETFWINEVETKLNEYNRFVGNLVGAEEVFTLVTSPSAFNALDWKKRRDMLLKISKVDVDEMLAGRPEFEAIVCEMREMGLIPDKLLKVYKDRRTAANKELEAVPIRIDEIQRGIVAVSDQALHEAEYNVADCEQTLESVEISIARQMAGGSQAELMAQIRAAERELSSYEDNFKAMRDQKIRAFEANRNSVKTEISMEMAMVERCKMKMRQLTNNIQVSEANRQALRDDWSRVYERQFDASGIEDHCPTCGQALPADKVAEAIENARNEFERRKADELAEIRQKGLKAKADVEIDQESLDTVQRDMASADQKIKELTEQYNAMKPIAEISLMEDAEYHRLSEALEALRAQRQDDDSQGMIQALEERKRDLRARLAANRQVVANAENAKAAQTRIQELLDAQRDLGQKVALYETRIMEIEQYILSRAALLEDTVNQMFPSVRWQLQKTNINGGVEDVCLCLVRNAETGALVPWAKANGAGKINAGLEIVNVLSEYYGITVPVFIDNAESVNSVIPTRGQQICLIVTEDRPMVFESIHNNKEEAA